MGRFGLVPLLITIVACGNVLSELFNQKQAEEACGIYSDTVHDHNQTSTTDLDKPSSKKIDGKVHLKDDKAQNGQAWPWEVLVKTKKKNLCTGMLINRKWVLISASCIVLLRKHDVIFVESASGEIVSSKRALVHENFTRTNLDANIGLLELRRPLSDKETLPVCLPRMLEKTVRSAECAVIMMTKNSKDRPKHWESNAAIMKDELCQEHDGGRTKISNKENLMCVGTKVARNVPCGSMSAPQSLVCKVSDMWSLFGFGKSCNKSKDGKMSTGYFLKIMPYLEWIKKNLDELKKNEQH